MGCLAKSVDLNSCHLVVYVLKGIYTKRHMDKKIFLIAELGLPNSYDLQVPTLLLTLILKGMACLR